MEEIPKRVSTKYTLYLDEKVKVFDDNTLP